MSNVGKIVIAGKDISCYGIVIPKDPAEAEVYAAEELVKYIELACGARLEIVSEAKPAIYVGGHGDGSLGDDGLEIKMLGEDLIITGDKPRGTLYGVYTFLEKLIGWRWYDHKYEKVKAADCIDVPADVYIREIPVFTMRGAYWHSLLRSREFCAKHKCNYEFAKMPEKLGGAVRYAGQHCHTLYNYIPIKEYYDEHPEYFSWDGKTLNDVNLEPESQPCLTNPDVLEIVKRKVREALEKNPDAKLVSVTQLDNQSYCKCPECARVDEEEGSHAGTMLRFVNAIAEDIEKDYPDVTVDTFAYQYGRKPPKITKPRKNVQIRLCPIECCYLHPLDDPDCAVNREFMEDFAGWSEMCDTLAIWDYPANFENYCAIMPNFRVLRRNARMFADHNVKRIMADGNCNVNGEFGALRTYLLAKLYWDPYMSEEEYQYHIVDFLQGYYGPGWRMVYDCLKLAEKRLDEYTEGTDYVMTCFCLDAYYGMSLEDGENLRKAWEEAYALAEDEEQREHFRKFYTCLVALKWGTNYYNALFDPSYNEARDTAFEELKAYAIKEGIVHKSSKCFWEI